LHLLTPPCLFTSTSHLLAISFSADGNDYEGNFTQALLFSSAKNSTLCVSVNISGDSLVEDEETFVVIFSSNDSRDEIINDNTTITIVDDDGRAIKV
jgi:hypothetical protein